MPIFKNMLAPLPALSSRVRFILVVCCYLLSCAIVATGMLATQYPSFGMFFVPFVVLASWWFKQRGALLSVASVLVTLAILNTIITGGLYWQPPLLFAFILGASALSVVSTLVSFLSYALDMSRTAQVKAQQA